MPGSMVRNSECSPLDSPESIPTVFVEAWNNRDPDKLASIFDADAEFVNVTGLWWHDRESIRKARAYGLEHIFDRSTLRLVRVKVRRLSDDIAVVHARMSLMGQTPVGEVASPRTRHTLLSHHQARLLLPVALNPTHSGGHHG